MTLNGVLELLDRHPGHRGNVDASVDPGGKTGGESPVTVRRGARAAFLASLWRRQRGPILVVTPRPDDARRLHDQLLTYLGEEQPIHLLPEPEVLPFERLAVDANTGNQRLTALAALAEAGRFAGQTPDVQPLVVCSVGSALLYTLPPELMAGVFPATGELSYINGGHEAPIIVGVNGVKERLSFTGPAVGIMPDMNFEIRQTILEPGDTLLAYTDGVTDARNPEGKSFTEQRLLSLVEEPIPSAAALVERIESSVNIHISDASQFDDITMLVVRRSPATLAS
ncbi:MAG: SpoIIE family protein phosphatase [Chloroflexi bacterium]|nr:SpoIIE family protein phosphatase [Chloroflexota bacterium]